MTTDASAVNRINRKVTLASRPVGVPEESDFAVEEETIGELGDDEVLVAVEVLSMDAFIRTTLDEGSFHGTVPIGGTITALGAGCVVESTSERLAVGDSVVGGLGAQTMAKVPAAMLQPIDTSSVSVRTYLGALGLTTGLTAYVGMMYVGDPQPGDTVVVSGAAGAVGSFAGQIAKLAGAGKVIGIAGGPAKGAFLVDDLGFDASINYKADDVAAKLDEFAPEGIDVFFDNVGGDILDDVLFRIRERARVVICGAISQYGDMDNVAGPSNYLKLAERHSRMEGFTVSHFMDRFPEAVAAITGWLGSGELVAHEHIEHGIDSFPHALRVLLTGGHMGKLLVDVSGRPPSIAATTTGSFADHPQTKEP